MKVQSKQQVKATPKKKMTADVKKGEARISPRLAVNHNESFFTA
jgi:hypothetical protein